VAFSKKRVLDEMNKKAGKKLKVLPCPCCGNENLYVGKLMSVTLGVECNRALDGCGISLGRVYPRRMPKGLKTLEELDRYMLKQAVRAWNRRFTVK